VWSPPFWLLPLTFRSSLSEFRKTLSRKFTRTLTEGSYGKHRNVHGNTVVAFSSF
jgi:hypothetical protein